jgi:hypothetical protein
MGVRDLFFAIKARDETGAAFDRVKGNLRQVDGMAATVGDRFTRMGDGRNFPGVPRLAVLVRFPGTRPGQGGPGR